MKKKKIQKESGIGVPFSERILNRDTNRIIGRDSRRTVSGDRSALNAPRSSCTYANIWGIKQFS